MNPVNLSSLFKNTHISGNKELKEENAQSLSLRKVALIVAKVALAIFSRLIFGKSSQTISERVKEIISGSVPAPAKAAPIKVGEEAFQKETQKLRADKPSSRILDLRSEGNFASYAVDLRRAIDEAAANGYVFLPFKHESNAIVLIAYDKLETKLEVYDPAGALSSQELSDLKKMVETVLPAPDSLQVNYLNGMEKLRELAMADHMIKPRTDLSSDHQVLGAMSAILSKQRVSAFSMKAALLMFHNSQNRNESL